MTATVQIRVDARRVTEAARSVERAVQRFQASVKQARWPRPPLVHDHAVLFREPAYQDGQPYTDADQDDEDEDA